MKIYTSYYGNLRNIPDDIIPISIAGKSPGWYKGLEFKTLAPKYKFFMEWKSNKDNAFYIDHFGKDVLQPLNVDVVVDNLYRLSKGKDIVLICYEKVGEFCHRHLVKEWLCKNGYPCIEYIKDGEE